MVAMMCDQPYLDAQKKEGKDMDALLDPAILAHNAGEVPRLPYESVSLTIQKLLETCLLILHWQCICVEVSNGLAVATNEWAK